MSDIVTSRVFVDGEKGITAAKLNDIVASSVIQPSFYTGKPTASTADPPDVMLLLKSGAYTQVPVSTLANSISNAQIWSTRLRSFNAINNPNFEVDQRNVGTALTNPASLSFVQDRYQLQKSALTGTVNVALQDTSATPIVVPGTSFGITSKFQRFTVGTAQAALAAGDYFMFTESIEGPSWRELSLDVHSVQLLVRSSISGLAFSLTLRDPSNVRSLVKLCSIPSANIWTLITLPNIPVWPAGGTWTAAVGALGYTLSICLAAGTTYGAPANDTWQNGNYLGAVGRTNFLAATGATFDIAFVQHEPGPVCTTLMDKPFTQNLDECLRYYQKSYPYGVLAGSITGRYVGFTVLNGSTAIGNLSFHKTMAKTPALTCYNASTGTINQCYQLTAPSNPYQAASGTISDSGMGSMLNGAANFPTVGAQVGFFYTADTGW